MYIGFCLCCRVSFGKDQIESPWHLIVCTWCELVLLEDWPPPYEKDW
jgi:hypothetical protein